MQSRKGSLLESVANVMAGYLVAMATQAIAFPLLGIMATPGQNAALGVIFTVVSLIRSYALRRLFNSWN
ncbi:hypothetical protein EBZ80_25260 [bacterium]|nr:hypothetical protein [bacterium]